MAPVVLKLQESPDKFDSRIVLTGQHREMLDPMLQLFNLAPDHDLCLMQTAQSPTAVAGSVLHGLDRILEAENPDWVLVQGDTTTAMAAAIAAAYRKIKVGHIEAGLRTFDRHNPFPEELNRLLVGVAADLHFAPTQRARDNLVREGRPLETVLVTGNPVIDALKMTVARPCRAADTLLASLPSHQWLMLVTAHRRENFGAAFEALCDALVRLAEHYAGQLHILFPVHLNPAVRTVVHRRLGKTPAITLIEPLDYAALVHVMQHAKLVLTDSGGIQEEAPSLGKPVLVFRKTTERPEAVESGTVRLIGTDADNTYLESRRLLDNPSAYAQMARAINPYGDGQAAERIVAALA